MTDEEYRDLVLKHDKHIDLMAQSVETLAKTVSKTNQKLEDVIDVITVQNVLMEKLTALEKSCDLTFKVLGDKDKQLDTECGGVKSLEKDKLLFEEKIKVANNRIKVIETELKFREQYVNELRNLVKIKDIIVKTAIAFFVVGFLGILGYKSI
jgi:hypothetical protein